MRFKNTGFTIIECLISLLILVILMTGGMAFYRYSTDLMKAATHKRIALEIVNTKMEEIKNAGYYGVNPENPHDTPIAGLTGHESVSVTSYAGYKEVTVNITWQEPGKTGNQVITLETNIAK